MFEEKKYFPDWLYEAIVEDFLPWESAKNYSYEEFAEKYTLHDSLWIGLFANVTYEDAAILAIIWDAVWLPDEIAQSTSDVLDWPFLFLKVEKINQILTRNYQDIGGSNRGISDAELSTLGDGKKTLIITDHYGGEVEVTFSGEIKFLGLDREKKVLPI
jgi:hypothetical protein